MLKMNLLTVKKGEMAYEPINLTEREFWEYYLKLINIKQSINTLNDKEIRVLAFILAGDENKSYFNGAEANELKAALRMTKSDLSKIKSVFILKRFIEDTGVTRGDSIPVRWLRQFQKLVKAGIRKNTLPVLNFMFTFNINESNEANTAIS